MPYLINKHPVLLAKPIGVIHMCKIKWKPRSRWKEIAKKIEKTSSKQLLSMTTWFLSNYLKAYHVQNKLATTSYPMAPFILRKITQVTLFAIENQSALPGQWKTKFKITGSSLPPPPPNICQKTDLAITRQLPPFNGHPYRPTQPIPTILDWSETVIWSPFIAALP